MYQVMKKFYDPFKKRIVFAGEEIEVPEKYLDTYRPYIAIPALAEVKTDPAKQTEPLSEKSEQPKRKRK